MVLPYGHDQGYQLSYGPLETAWAWGAYDRIWAAGKGYFYGRASGNGGDLYLWRHHGFLVGDQNWTTGVTVGNGWGDGMHEVFLS